MSSLALCLGLATTATAQEEPAPVTFITGTVAEAYTYDADSGGRDTFSYDSRGYEVAGASLDLMRQVVEWSDPRLPPDLWLTLDHTLIRTGADGLDGAIDTASRSLLEDEEGRWRGTGRLVMDTDERYSFYVLTGEGAYEGLSALLHGVTPADAQGFWDLAYGGYILEAELTPFPDEPVPVTTGAIQMYP
jgi:hypothetical protein